jgi:tRNA nucleotidyltransferase (CCA-adding enzyme)
MADYIYLLENRLSADQQNALRQLREAAREAGIILFLTGDAVRDLTSGHAVRDLEVSVHGNALKLKKSIEKLGGVAWGESESSRTLYLCFPGTVRVDLVTTHRLDYAKISKPVFHPASIQEDLRRRDFTVNAMAISLNEGSFGLLMDPLNGAADIESRTLRLVSNYGFLEEPSLLIRATRYIARLGWELDPKTQTRYENAKSEGVIEQMSHEARSRELEQIGHEEDGLKVLRSLEGEGWMKFLFPAWTHAKADEEKLKSLHELAVELQVQGVHPDMSAAQMQLLTARMNPKDLAALKKELLRPGFVEEWNSLDAIAAKFAKVVLSKENSTASAGYKLFTSYDPEAVLWLGFTSKEKAVQERYNQFLRVWPEARQKIPHSLMQEMRITPELASYKDIVQALFLELIDGRLATAEELRAFLEPHSPPAPPPQVTVKRPRAKRGEAKVKERSYDDEDESEDGLEDEDIDDLGGDEEELDLGISIPKQDLDTDLAEDAEAESTDDESDGEEPEPEPPPAKRGLKGEAGKPAKTSAASHPKKAEPPQAVQAKPEAKAKSAKAKSEDRSASGGPSTAVHLKAAPVIQKAQTPPGKTQAVPSAAPAKPTGPGADKAGKPAAIRKEDQLASSNVTPASSKESTTGPAKSSPGLRPPQSVSGASGVAATAKPAKDKTAPELKRPEVAKPKAAVLKAPAAKSKPVAKAAAKPAAGKPIAPAKKAVAKKPEPKKTAKKH